MGKKGPSASSSKDSKKKNAVPEPEPELTPKQLKEKRREEARARAAETRKLVSAGANAWTGKLPAALLSEHCQKQKWEKVDYPMKGSGESFRASVILGKRNPKTKEIEKVRFDPPPELLPPQKTPVEARHLAATYAMHRMMSHANLKFLFPPVHRDLWVELDKDKANAPANMAWKWSKDPFEAAAARKESRKKFEEGAENRKARNEASELRRAIASTKLAEEQATVQPKEDSPAVEQVDEPLKKRIRFNSTLVMARQTRAMVENVIRENHGFRFSESDGLSKQKHPELYASLEKTLIRLGFADHQCREALEYSHTLSTALVWLLVHVPEDDLPQAFQPTSAHGVTARVSAGLSVESAVSKIREYGYAENVARSAVTEADGSIPTAVVNLTAGLAGLGAIDFATHIEDDGMWNEECESLKAVMQEGDVQVSERQCAVKLRKAGLIAVFYEPPKGYPEVVAGIALKQDPKSTKAAKKIPKYVLLDCTRRAAVHAASELRGSYMISELAQYIEDIFPEVLKNPSPLSQISSGVSGVHEELPSSSKSKSTKRTARKQTRPNVSQQQLDKRMQARQESQAGKNMIEARKQLPAWAKQKEVESLLSKHQVVLVTGETGSGKSTQIVQFVLDSLIAKGAGSTTSIVCTQPRRISAIGVAQRVAEERVTELGDEVGYVIRGESRASASTQIRFVTAGVLLRMLQTDADGTLEGFSHIVVDEVHERSLDGDFLLILLKRALKKHKHLKVILMSATVDPNQFKKYFAEVVGEVGYTHITGRTFPVERLWLNDVLEKTGYVPRNLDAAPGEVGKIINAMRDNLDYGLIAATVNHIHQSLGSSEGSVLVFMSGAGEIDRALRAIESSPAGPNLYCLPLHASLPPAEQRRVFSRAPKGKRKIVVCTNVAETSITIADVVAVVDSGRVKETLYDADAHVTRLVDNWTSQASATQRMGRAGRVRAGTCYKLYTEALQSSKMPARPAPEMLRAPLENLYLSVKAMGIGNVEKFLNGALDPPDAASLDSAANALLDYGALVKSGDDGKNTLTPLGMHMSLLPVDPKTAKLLVLGTMLGCLPRCLTVAAIVAGSRSTLSAPQDVRDAAKEHHRTAFGADGSGDLLAACRAYESYLECPCKERRKWCSTNYVSFQACSDVQSARQQLLGALALTGLVPPGPESQLPAETKSTDDSLPLVRAVIGASLRPFIAEIVMPQTLYKSTVSGTLEVDPEAKQIRFFTPSSARVFMHPRSLLFGVSKYVNEAKYLSYASAIQSSKHFVSDITPLSLYGMAMFSSSIEIDPLGSGIVVDNWTGLNCWARAGVLIQFLQQLFGDILLAKFDNPRLDISNHAVIRAVHELIDTEGRGWDH